MILGVDHVALSCEDVEAASRTLQEAGYRPKFIHKDAPNSPVKRPFLKVYDPLHSVAYCRPQTGTYLELTQHGGPIEDAHSPYQVLLGASPPETEPFAGIEAAWSLVWRAALGCQQPEAACWSPLHAQLWHERAVSGPEQSGVRAVLVPVADAEQAERFWQEGLGCHPVAEGSFETGRRWVHVAFQAPVPNWSLDVILAEGRNETHQPLLDTAGFPCLGLLTTSLERDSERLWRVGARDSSGEFQVEINGKNLRVEVFRGTDQELIELIEIPRGNK